MSVKRILGSILASRLGGRGRRGGMMGSSSMMTGMRRRRGGSLAGKAGLAALGYMAYRAYQDRQSSGSGGTSTGQGSASGGGGIAGMVQDVVDRVTGGSGSQGGATGSGSQGGVAASGSQAAAASEPPGDPDLAEDASSAERMSEEKALLLIRAMITAAYSDGALSDDERARIMDEIDEAGGTEEDRRLMEAEIANPKPLDELLAQVNDRETAEEFYLASNAAVDGQTEANRAYLERLRQRLDLTQEQAAEIEEIS